jgi:ABC-type uncharacterized transport system involved in gliding motility auxiliary subunit
MATKKTSATQYKFNHYVGILVVLVLFVTANYIGFKKYYHRDLSLNRYADLSPQSIGLVQSLPQDLRLTLFLSPETDMSASMILDSVEELVKEYRYRSKGKIEFRKVNASLDPQGARELMQKFKLTAMEYALVVEYGEAFRVLKVSELADIDSSGAMFQQPPRVRAFKAEELITAAIQELVQGKKSVVYFLTGHNEYNPLGSERDDFGYSKLADYLKRQNSEVKTLSLTSTGSIPEDLDVLVIAGPQQALTAPEIEVLQNFLHRGGERPARLILLLDPTVQSGLENFLQSYGITYDNDIALAQFLAPGGVVIFPEAIASQFADHPTTAWTKSGQAELPLGACRSLTLNPPAAAGEPATAPLALAKTPASYWGESDVANVKQAKFNEGQDKAGPLTIAALVDTGSVQGGEVKLAGTKIVAIGGASFLANKLVRPDQIDFFLNIYNWMLEKETSLGITPKTPQNFSISLPDDKKSTLTMILFFLFPGIAALAGILMWLRRRA